MTNYTKELRALRNDPMLFDGNQAEQASITAQIELLKESAGHNDQTNRKDPVWVSAYYL